MGRLNTVFSWCPISLVKNMEEMRLYDALLSFSIALLAWPMCFTFNKLFSTLDPSALPIWMLTIGSLMLTVVVVATIYLSKIRDWIYYGSTCFQFTSMITFMISLEHIGLISGFIGFYQKFGEKYLLSPYGFSICVFDGLGFQTMYIIMILQLSNRKSWRSVGIYYSSAIITNMALIVSGYLVGTLDFVPCSLLNLPYFIFPAYILSRALDQQEEGYTWDTILIRGIALKILDAILVIGFVMTIIITVLKGGAVLGGSLSLIQYLLENDRALMLREPTPFATFQTLMYLFYGLPIQILSLYCLLRNKIPGYLWEFTLAHAGLLLPGQFCYILAAVLSETPTEFQCDWANWIFWSVNLLILLIPHLFLYRLSFNRRQIEETTEIQVECVDCCLDINNSQVS